MVAGAPSSNGSAASAALCFVMCVLCNPLQARPRCCCCGLARVVGRRAAQADDLPLCRHVACVLATHDCGGRFISRACILDHWCTPSYLFQLATCGSCCSCTVLSLHTGQACFPAKLKCCSFQLTALSGSKEKRRCMLRWYDKVADRKRQGMMRPRI
ncbi:hypothetical protein COO60DRAFT_1537198 [Scenedesmus sp. NREL 46B-D3]|nr:hypothetical protein COO60DRAFT_1537198 [Scenedesmus sp. NREL 46B-D3]